MSTKLDNSMAQRNKTQKALDCTRTVLHKHEGKNFGQVSNLPTQKRLVFFRNLSHSSPTFSIDIGKRLDFKHCTLIME